MAVSIATERETGWVSGRSYECVRMNVCVRKMEVRVFIVLIWKDIWLPFVTSQQYLPLLPLNPTGHPIHTLSHNCAPPPPPPFIGHTALLASHHFCLCAFAPPPPYTVDFLPERERVVCNQMTTTDNPAIHPLCPVHLERSERAAVEERKEVKEARSVWAEGKETRGGSGRYAYVHVHACVWREGGCWLTCGHEGNRSCL